MLRSEKEASVKDLEEMFGRTSSAVFVNFQGMTVQEVSNLRNAFRKQGVTYRVAKNTLIERALGNAPFVKALAPSLKGMTGVAWSFEEPSAAARVVKEFRRDNEKLTVKAGLLDGRLLDAKDVEEKLATLPSKSEARAQLLATLIAPPQQFVMLLNTPAGNFARILQAKASKG